MKSFTTLRDQYGELTKNTSSANLTDADEVLNDEHRTILSSHPWSFLEDSTTISTVASQQPYDLPGNIDKLINVTVTVGNNIYTPRYKPSRIFWDIVNDNSSSPKSDTPEIFTVFAKQVLLYPIPSTTAGTITFYYRRRVRDLSVADYTTGTVTAINGDETITGTTTSWTTGQVDKWLRITHTSAADKGDGIWYEIDSITSGTALELRSPYDGVTISSATAYTLADMPFLPEAFHTLILWRPLARYWALNKRRDLAREYKDSFAEDFSLLKKNYTSETDNIIIEDGEERQIHNPNLFITL